MDNFRAFEDSIDADVIAEEEPVMEAPPEIGTDERRMHVRAYNYWVSLLDGRAYPSVQDLEPENLDDFGPHSVLLDFTAGTDDPVVSFIGGRSRGVQARQQYPPHQRRAEPLAALAPDRPLSTDHRQLRPIGFEASSSARAARTPCIEAY
jgi:hypothetical protein